MEPAPGVTIIVGPTGVGKTAFAHDMARAYGAPILSADSRQIYRHMSIGTAAPSLRLRSEVDYYFVQTLSPDAVYSAYDFAEDALQLTSRLLSEGHERVLIVGGSMLYIQALLFRMDPIPGVPAAVRTEVRQLFQEKGLAPIREELRRVDPLYLDRVDPNNHRRLIRALEVYRSTGRAFSSFHTGCLRDLPFPVQVIALERDREVLYERINRRVEEMLAEGLVAEAQALLPYRDRNALRTIGYKECFAYLDGKITLEECKRLIQKNTRVFARQQLRFFQKLPGVQVIRLDGVHGFEV